MKLLTVSIFTAVFLATTIVPPASAAEEKGKGEEKAEEEKEEGPKPIEEVTEDHDVMKGLFTFYRDPKSGKTHLELGADQLDQEFVYWMVIDDSALEAGAFRGAFDDSKIIRFRKYFDRIEIVEENTFHYFDAKSSISRAADANISPAVLASAKIVGQSKDEKRYLIESDGFFATEALRQISPSPNPEAKPGTTFALGDLAADRSKIVEIRAYPKNTDIRVDYVFSNPKPIVRGSPAVANPRSVVVSAQHSLIAMPDTGFVPRVDDPRVGYFFDRKTDLTSVSATPYRDLITRWRLVKKNPRAKVSEPVKPITWWIENTTPVEYRETIRDAVLAWNLAFEKAGFKNAVVVKIQPDDAKWDAGDIRYNVLRWTSSPQPPFGGYGPSFSNPRTGEIIGADIMLEQVFVTNRLVYNELFDLAGRGIAPDAIRNHLKNRHTCSAGHHLALQNRLGRIAATLPGATKVDDARILKEGLYFLALHEVGHTLGLNHNMKASSASPYEGIYDKKTTKGVLASSVMDYPALNLAPDGSTSSNYYTTRPGTYDDWAIQFGYDPILDDPKARAEHLALAGKREHTFGNDADDMRAPGVGHDPRVMIGDMSDDGIAYSIDRLGLIKNLLAGLSDRYEQQEGQSYHELRDWYLILTGQQDVAGRVLSRFVGGVYEDRSFVGDPREAGAPFVPVDYDDQKRAMKALRDHFFAPTAFSASDELLSQLQIQRRGFGAFGQPTDPAIHGRVLKIQGGVLDHLLHPNTLRRITDSRLYGSEYSAFEVVDDLTKAVFEADATGDVNTQRQNLQVEYAKRLATILGGAPGYDHVARSAALAGAQSIYDWMGTANEGSAETRAHRAHVRLIIESALYPNGRR